jgi:hypothetical protein
MGLRGKSLCGLEPVKEFSKVASRKAKQEFGNKPEEEIPIL